ncbi:hypothetical protein DHEL01_v207140 [Diaporthe helianthi]|uniref:Secreted protein n=1 Tax=Diaporthe helianthi TaxID=158607 RepID=A0A2P5HW29_DIAHE|nr:hypothetical protein DHEL01_v207140 [Diaporthe helianthi]
MKLFWAAYLIQIASADQPAGQLIIDFWTTCMSVEGWCTSYTTAPKPVTKTRITSIPTTAFPVNLGRKLTATDMNFTRTSRLCKVTSNRGENELIS